MLAFADDCAVGLDNVIDIGGNFPASGDTRRELQARKPWRNGAVHIHQCVRCPECYLCAAPL